MRLLVIEDETRIVELLRQAFERSGFVVDSVGSITAGDQALSLVAYDAVILDLGLPDGDGLRMLARIRGAGNRVPVLILTARDAVEDRVGGLDRGADDYLVKPFAVTELISRIKALLRRPGHALGITLRAGNLVFDTIGRDVHVGSISVSMPRHELAILEHLMRRMGRVVPRAVLEEKLYGMNDPLESNAIPVHVHHLRRRLAEVGATPAIHTVRGIGYLLTEKPA
ncbi:MAG TPA: response regulator [Steroidobacteraceae bacterium]|jgi:DNA-binding response OmpR family regulator|nr:response regulator [Steroidobacteraceae bacterium]